MAKHTTYDADSIAVLEGLEAVRKRPGMYIGSVSSVPGFRSLKRAEVSDVVASVPPLSE